MKRDKYSRARGGTSQMLDLKCANCGNDLFLYQKDGPGRLLRCYLDRIFDKSMDEGMPVKCSQCGTLIGTPMVYAPENRPAIRLIYGSFRKSRHE